MDPENMKNGLLLLNCDAKKQECCLVIFTEFINILGKNSPPTIQQLLVGSKILC